MCEVALVPSDGVTRSVERAVGFVGEAPLASSISTLMCPNGHRCTFFLLFCCCKVRISLLWRGRKMGSSASRDEVVGLQPIDGASKLSETGGSLVNDRKYLGLDNFGNTCYCNSVIQLLYSCEALRTRLLQLYEDHFRDSKIEGERDTVLARLCELFALMQYNKKTKGSMGPLAFIKTVKRENEMFRNSFQQDAHEFAMYIINELVDGEKKLLNGGENSFTIAASSGSGNAPTTTATPKGHIQELFEGQLASETTCLECDTTTTKGESFLDLSLDVEPNVSLRHCISSFSSPEFLSGDDRFRCEACCAPVLARRSLRLLEGAPLLFIHLKRFKYFEARQAFQKLAYRIPFPSDLVVPFKANDATVGTAHYALVGCVVHVGAGPNLGHYFACCANSGHQWFKFDDDIVSQIRDTDLQYFFGNAFSVDYSVTATAYIVMYQRKS